MFLKKINRNYFLILLLLFCLSIFLISIQDTVFQMKGLLVNVKANQPHASAEKPKFFRADGETLLGLYNIPEMPDPKTRLKTMKPFAYQATKSERLTFYKLIQFFVDVMQSNGITFFINGGTLLGSYRYHDFIPWDDDVDIYVSSIERQQMRQAFNQSNIPNLVLYETSSHDKLFLSNESVQSSPYRWKWPYIDISFYTMNETHIADIAVTYGRRDTLPKSVIFPLSVRPFFTLDLPSPKDTFAYIAWCYGYTDECVVNSYSHMVEGGGISGRSKCDKLASEYPHVNRFLENDQIVEELVFDGKILQRIQVNEPSYAVSQPYVIELKEKYFYPKDVPLPMKNQTGVF